MKNLRVYVLFIPFLVFKCLGTITWFIVQAFRSGYTHYAE